MERDPNTIYTLSLSYGKDSLACLGAIKMLGLPLDRIIHAEIWATETIPADLPPMVEFKKKADKIIKKRYGIEVEHVYAVNKTGGGVSTYEQLFNTATNTEEYGEHIFGFPKRNGAWCVSRLKQNVLTETNLRGHFLSNTQTSCGVGGEENLLRVPDGQRTMVQQSTQSQRSQPNLERTGWATRWSQYCTGELKKTALRDSQYQSIGGIGVPNSKRRVFFKPKHDGRYKYRAVSWNRCGRA